nr:ribonuclease H-like domain-containing protein [Tanacetum cinerariifolium]
MIGSCLNFPKGFFQFGDSCKYVHKAQPNSSCNSQASNIVDNGSSSNNTTNDLFLKLLETIDSLGVTVHSTSAQLEGLSLGANATPHVAFHTFSSPSGYPYFQPTSQARTGSVGNTVTPRQDTTVPHAFIARTLHDLNTDLMTCWVLLRCDSTGDLYSVTAPSHIPHVFLVSQHTWHQRPGHPGSEVLRRLVSNKLNSCNTEKPPVLCHACQFGKHVRLSFVSSNTMVTSCFDIIHSNVWTSPIPSLS